MDDSSSLRLGVLALFIALAAFGSAAEAAFSTINRFKIKRLHAAGVRGAELLDQLLEEPRMLLGTVLLLKSAALIGAAILGTLLAIEALPSPWGLPTGAALLVLADLVLVEALPRAIAERMGERMAQAIAGPMRLLTRLLHPFAWLISWLTGVIGGNAKRHYLPVLSIEDLRLIVSADGLIEKGEQEMIKRIFSLEETTVREIMVPRMDIVAAPRTATMLDVARLIVERGKTRIPLYEDSIDNIVGIVYAKDLLRYLGNGQPLPSLVDIARPAYFIPETKRIDELLRELQQKKVHMAIVVDEYGGTAGLVTIEDLLEEIVGEIQDEYDVEEAPIERISEDEAILDSRVGIDKLGELFGIDLATEEIDTVGGFIYNQLGKIPTAGDEVRVDGLKLTVLSTVGRRIKKVRVSRVPADEQVNGSGSDPSHSHRHPALPSAS